MNYKKLGQIVIVIASIFWIYSFAGYVWRDMLAEKWVSASISGLFVLLGLFNVISAFRKLIKGEEKEVA